MRFPSRATLSPQYIDRLKEQVHGLIENGIDYAYFGDGLDACKDMVESPEISARVIPLNTTCEMVVRPMQLDSFHCDSYVLTDVRAVDPAARQMWEDAAAVITSTLKDYGIPIALTTDWSHEVPAGMERSIPTAICTGIADSSGKPVGGGFSDPRYIMTAQSTLQTAVHECGHYLGGLIHPFEIKGFDELEPAVKDYICAAGPDQAGSIMQYPEHCPGDSALTLFASRDFGPLDMAMFQQRYRYTEGIDPGLMEQIEQGVIERAELLESLKTGPWQAMAPHLISTMVGRIVERSLNHVLLRHEFDPQRAKQLTAVLSGAIQSVLLTYFGGYGAATGAMLSTGAFASSLILRSLPRNVLSALGNVLGTCSIVFAIRDALFGNPLTCLSRLLGGYFGREIGNVVCASVEALLKFCVPAAELDVVKSLMEPDLMQEGPVATPLDEMNVLGRLNEQLTRGIEKYVDLNILTTWIYWSDLVRLAAQDNTPIGHIEAAAERADGESGADLRTDAAGEMAIDIPDPQPSDDDDVTTSAEGDVVIKMPDLDADNDVIKTDSRSD